jgi:hypothetical protein
MSVNATAQDRETAVRLVGPPGGEVVLGDEFTVDIVYETDEWYWLVAAYEVLSFDNSKLEVLDDDGVAPGVQITPGECPQPDEVGWNEGNNPMGFIGYDAWCYDPADGCNGGVIATARFEATGLGTTVIDITDSHLYEPDERGRFEIPHVTYGTTIVIGVSPVEQSTWGTVKALYR